MDPAEVRLLRRSRNRLCGVLIRMPRAQMVDLIKTMRKEGNSVGGVIECVVRGVPPGLGEPVFDKLEADLAKAMLSLPATKGFEIGSGFAEYSAYGRGTQRRLRNARRQSAHPDQFLWRRPGRDQQR